MFGAVELIKLHKCQFEDDECKAHPRKDTIPRKQNVDLPWEFVKIGTFRIGKVHGRSRSWAMIA